MGDQRGKTGGLERSQWMEFGSKRIKKRNTEGGERKIKRAGVIAVSPERNRGIGVDYSKETDKAPLTAASSCFLRLCHHMTPP